MKHFTQMKHRTLMMALVGLLAGSSAGLASSLSNDDITSQIAGRRIYLAALLGGEFPLNYRRSGEVLCFRLSWVGERKLRWVRDNGDVGTARIGERLE